MESLTEVAHVSAPPETVWHDLTDAAALAEWFWPPRLEATTVVEPHLRGLWQVTSSAAGMAVQGEVLAADPPRELRLLWRWSGEEHTTDVTITLEPAADASTRVTVRHIGFSSAVERDDLVQGWTDCLDRLVARHAPPGR